MAYLRNILHNVFYELLIIFPSARRRLQIVLPVRLDQLHRAPRAATVQEGVEQPLRVNLRRPLLPQLKVAVSEKNKYSKVFSMMLLTSKGEC